MSTARSRWCLKLPKFLLCNFVFVSVFQLGIYWAAKTNSVPFMFLLFSDTHTHTHMHVHSHTDT